MVPILQVNRLAVTFKMRSGTTHAVNGIDYTLHRGETLGVVGESGCGKTVSTLAILKLISMPPGEITDGRAIYDGKVDLLSLPIKKLRPYRGREIAVIFQDPMTAFNQVMTVGDQMIEGHMEHFKSSRKEALKEAERLMELTGIPSPRIRLKDYPTQFSGGMRQRALIAMALMCEPSILIADEPTTALDVTIQSQIIDLMKDIKTRLGTSIIWVSHDLGVVAGISDTVQVMYAGTIVEKARVDDLYYKPLHPYTRGLLSSLPSSDDDKTKRLSSIGGYPPILTQKLSGCPFAPRCGSASERCFAAVPPLITHDKNHSVACFYA